MLIKALAIKEVGLLLNDLSSQFVDVNENLLFCAHCGNAMKQEKLQKHHYKNHKGKRVKTAKFMLKDYATDKGVGFYFLKGMLKRDQEISESKLISEYQDLKKIVNSAIGELKEKNIQLSLSVLLKHVYSTPSYCDNIPTNIKELLLRLASVKVNEAIWLDNG